MRRWAEKRSNMDSGSNGLWKIKILFPIRQTNTIRKRSMEKRRRTKMV